MGAWVSDEDAAAFVGVQVDVRLVDALAATEAYCQRQRSDLDPNSPPDAAVRYAVKIRTKLLYSSRAAASQFADYDEYSQATDQAALGDFYQLLGSRRPRVG